MPVTDLTVEVRSRRVWLMRMIPTVSVLPRNVRLWIAAFVLRLVVIEMRYGTNDWQRLNLWSSLEAAARDL